MQHNCILVLLAVAGSGLPPSIKTQHVRQLRRLEEAAQVEVLHQPPVMVRIDDITLHAGENDIQTSQIDSEFIYVMTNGSPSTVVKIKKTVPLKRISHLQLNPGENFVENSVSDATSMYRVFICCVFENTHTMMH